MKKFVFWALGITVIVLVLGGISINGFLHVIKNAHPSGVTFAKSNVFEMGNGLKVIYPDNWISQKGDNAYVVDLRPQDGKTTIEVSYNVLENEQSKDVKAWRTDIETFAKSNPELGIATSSIEIKKILGNDVVGFNEVNGLSYLTQIIFPVDTALNKFLHFTLKTDKSGFYDGQIALGEIITKLLIANNQQK